MTDQVERNLGIDLTLHESSRRELQTCRQLLDENQRTVVQLLKKLQMCTCHKVAKGDNEQTRLPNVDDDRSSISSMALHIAAEGAPLTSITQNAVGHKHTPVLLTNLVSPFGYQQPVEMRLQYIIESSEALNLSVVVHRFSEILPGQSLIEHIRHEELKGEPYPRPWEETSYMYSSPQIHEDLYLKNADVARKVSCSYWTGMYVASPGYSKSSPLYNLNQLQSIMKTVKGGDYSPYMWRGLAWPVPGMPSGRDQVRPYDASNVPFILLEDDGRRYFALYRQGWFTDPEHFHQTCMREAIMLKNTPVSLTIVHADTGRIISQNLTSTTLLGYHGTSHVANPGSSVPWFLQKSIKLALEVQSSGCVSVTLLVAVDASRMRAHVDTDFSYLDLLFDHDQELLLRLQKEARSGFFAVRQEITNRMLRDFMGLKDGQPAHFDIKVTRTLDPVTRCGTYAISQVDVTEMVLAEIQLRVANEQLAEEKERMNALIQRQVELIACLGKVGGMEGHSGSQTLTDLLDNVRQHLLTDGGGTLYEPIEVFELIGKGSFGVVHKGMWKGTMVAVKTMVLSGLSDGEKRERMAIMEAAISKHLSHPNIVQTFTYSLRPVGGGGEGSLKNFKVKAGDIAVSQAAAEKEQLVSAADQNALKPLPAAYRDQFFGFEVKLVLEYCSLGNLRQALDKRVFITALGYPDYHAVLELAADIARGMLHLHSLNIIHSDLKASNILLQANDTNKCNITAKVADFGLSLKMDAADTHISNSYSGTLPYMAPELVKEGVRSKAADVYAFGITLWEMFTGGTPYKGVAQMLLSYSVVHEGLRPQFPLQAPPDLVSLATSCWHPVPSKRPTFAAVLKDLATMISNCQKHAANLAAGGHQTALGINDSISLGSFLMQKEAGSSSSSGSVIIFYPY